MQGIPEGGGTRGLAHAGSRPTFAAGHEIRPRPGPNRAGRRASNFQVRLAAPRLHNRARRATPPTTFQLRFPEGPRGSEPGAQGGPAKLAMLGFVVGRVLPASFPQRSTSFGHLSFPYLASKQFVSGARAVSPAPPALSLWEPFERVAADSCASGLRVSFAVSTAPGPFCRPGTVPSAGVRLESPAPREGGRSLCSAGGEGRASTKPRGRSPERSSRAGGVYWGVGLPSGPARSASALPLLPESAARTRGAPGQGWLLGSDWPASAPSLFRRLSLQSEVADTQETVLTAQSLLPTSLEPPLRGRSL